MGPNHTLVLVNGRRIADYPQAYQGNSNFTDISNIPTTMIDQIDILSGSDSAIYGSDAIAGVINFVLKKRADGTTLDFREGETQLGGGSSQRFTLTSGCSNDRFDSIFTVQLLNQQPVWAFRRNFTDSTLDAPGGPADNYADPVFGRYDMNGNFIAPRRRPAMRSRYLDGGSVFYASRPGYGPNGGNGYYCGSHADIGYGTLENGRKSLNFYGAATYELTDMPICSWICRPATRTRTATTPRCSGRTACPERRFRAGAFLQFGHRPDRAVAADVFHPR